MPVADLRRDLPAEIPNLLRYARTIDCDPHRAEDLVQDTLVRALERADSFREEASLRTWLHRILHNLAVDGMRRERHEVVADWVEQVDAAWRDDAFTLDAARVVEAAETAADLRDALVRLPYIYRSAVVLHDEQELTVEHIARIQGVSLAAAKQRLRRGRMMLVSALAEGSVRRVEVGVPLRCWDARSRVSDYLDGEVDAAERRMLERHLQGCPTCPPLYAALVGTRAALGRQARDPDTVVPPGLAERIQELLAG